MLTLKDLSQRYSLSPKQVRRYWEAISPLCAPFARRGPHNTTLISEQALPLFDRLLALLQEGLSLPAAVEQLREELNGSGQARLAPAANSGPQDELLALLKAQLAEKDRQIAELLTQLRDLQQRALPPPRRSWWARLFGR